MKKPMILLLVVLSLFATFAVAENREAENDDEYHSTIIYPGQYEADRLYQQHLASKIWLKTGAPAFYREIKCLDSYVDLRDKGTWVGRLNADGSCADPEEGRKWATGNYLNYLYQLIRRSN